MYIYSIGIWTICKVIERSDAGVYTRTTEGIYSVLCAVYKLYTSTTQNIMSCHMNADVW